MQVTAVTGSHAATLVKQGKKEPSPPQPFIPELPEGMSGTGRSMAFASMALTSMTSLFVSLFRSSTTKARRSPLPLLLPNTISSCQVAPGHTPAAAPLVTDVKELGPKSERKTLALPYSSSYPADPLDSWIRQARAKRLAQEQQALKPRVAYREGQRGA